MANNIIKIDGIEYVKCAIPTKAWNDCLTPCVFCNAKVQEKCQATAGCRNGFCGDEHVCYIDFNDLDC